MNHSTAAQPHASPAKPQLQSTSEKTVSQNAHGPHTSDAPINPIKFAHAALFQFPKDGGPRGAEPQKVPKNAGEIRTTK